MTNGWEGRCSPTPWKENTRVTSWMCWEELGSASQGSWME